MEYTVPLLFAAFFASVAIGTSPTAAPTMPPASTPVPSPGAAEAPALPQGTYEYAFRLGGATLGSAAIAVIRNGGALKTHEVADLRGRYIVDQTLDPASFAPSSVDATYPGAKPTQIHVGLDRGAIVESVAGSGSRQIAPPAGKGMVVLDGPVMSGFFLAPAQAQAAGATSLAALSPGSAQTFSLSVSAAKDSSRPSFVPRGDRGIDIEGLASGGVTIWFDPATLVPDDCEVPAQSLSIVLVRRSGATTGIAPVSTPAPLPTPVPRFRSVPVLFRSYDGTRLSGTLTVPDGLHGKAPGIVFVHGSGPNTREEQIGPNAVFGQLSNALSNHGFIVLRYDKRGVGKSGGNYAAITRNQLIADARAAVRFLLRRPEIDPHRVFALGHSEGGELVPSLAADDVALRGIVLMAPPALPLDQILLQQAAHGLTGAAAAKARTEQVHTNFAIRTGIAREPGSVWLRSSFGIDPVDLIRKVPCPILILQGGKDFQVLAKDLPRLVNAAKAAHRDVTVRLFPNDDHLFITIPSTAQSSIAEYMTPHRLDPAMIDAMLSWLRRNS